MKYVDALFYHVTCGNVTRLLQIFTFLVTMVTIFGGKMIKYDQNTYIYKSKKFHVHRNPTNEFDMGIQPYEGQLFKSVSTIFIFLFLSIFIVP